MDALRVALETMFSPRAARDLDATYQLVVDGEPYVTDIANGHFEVRRGRTDDAAATLRTDRSTLQTLVFANGSLDDTLARGTATTTGPKRSVIRLLGLFPK